MEAEHPHNTRAQVRDHTAKAIFRLLTEGKEAAEKRRKDQVARWAARAAELEVEE